MAGAYSEVSNNKKYSPYFYPRKNVSDELDVFEAARYYSGQSDGLSRPFRTRRMSLDDEHVKRPSFLLPQEPGKQVSNNDNSRHRFEQRQPKSPGGRFASFLNSLFNHSSSKKKAPTKSSSAGGSRSVLQSWSKECEDPDQPRRRRSSISHFSSSTKESDSETIRTDGVSIFFDRSHNSRTSMVATPTKWHDLRSSLSDRRQASASNKLMASTGDITKKTSLLELKSSDKKEMTGSSSRFHGKLNNNIIGKEDCSKESTIVDHEGEDSDSSSDLFELQIGTGSYYLGDLPVYETTHIENIRTGTPPI